MLYVYTYPKILNCDFDLSRTPSNELAGLCKLIVEHHSDTNKTVFLGYLEGWMLENMHSTIMRELIRKFNVYIVSVYPEHLTYAWKNEICTIFKSHNENE